MSTYYFLLNHTEKEYIHYDNYVKNHQWQKDDVKSALVEYLFETIGDDLQFVSDDGCFDDKLEKYQERDLSVKRR